MEGSRVGKTQLKKLLLLERKKERKEGGGAREALAISQELTIPSMKEGSLKKKKEKRKNGEYM